MTIEEERETPVMDEDSRKPDYIVSNGAGLQPIKDLHEAEGMAEQLVVDAGHPIYIYKLIAVCTRPKVQYLWHNVE